MAEQKDIRGLGSIDRIALRVLSGLILAGFIGLFTILNRNTTSLAVMQSDLKNFINNTSLEVTRINSRVSAVESILNTRTQDIYTFKDSSRDQKMIYYRIEKLEKRIEKLEEK